MTKAQRKAHKAANQQRRSQILKGQYGPSGINPGVIQNGRHDAAFEKGEKATVNPPLLP